MPNLKISGNKIVNNEAERFFGILSRIFKALSAENEWSSGESQNSPSLDLLNIKLSADHSVLN